MFYKHYILLKKKLVVEILMNMDHIKILFYIFTAYKLYLFTAYGPDLGFKSHKSYQDSGLSYVNHMT